jgi:predicted transposase YbfD/YdcC
MWVKMSTDELREIIGSVVEEKLKEILGDPDEALEIRANVRNRLLRQKQAVANGERGRRDERDCEAVRYCLNAEIQAKELAEVRRETWLMLDSASNKRFVNEKARHIRRHHREWTRQVAS